MNIRKKLYIFLLFTDDRSARAVHEPMEKATKAVENAAASLTQLVLPWRSTNSNGGEGEWYKMSLKKRKNEEEGGQEGEATGSEFVMKIEPEIGKYDLLYTVFLVS